MQRSRVVDHEDVIESSSTHYFRFVEGFGYT